MLLTATDTASNFLACNVTVAVVDTEAPRFVCPYAATGGVLTVSTDYGRSNATNVSGHALWVDPPVWDNVDREGNSAALVARGYALGQKLGVVFTVANFTGSNPDPMTLALARALTRFTRTLILNLTR